MIDIGDRDLATLAALTPALWHDLPRSTSVPARCLRALLQQVRRPRMLANGMLKLANRAEGSTERSRTSRHELLARDGVLLGAWSRLNNLSLGALPPNSVIGRYSSIGSNVVIANENHPLDRLSTSGVFYHPLAGFVSQPMRTPPLLMIGHDVWIGSNACILPRCRRIGHDAVIGAGAVVTHDVEPLAIVGGNPARVIRMRFESEFARVWLSSRWWNQSPTTLAQHGTTALSLETLLRLIDRSLDPSAAVLESDRAFERRFIDR